MRYETSNPCFYGSFIIEILDLKNTGGSSIVNYYVLMDSDLSPKSGHGLYVKKVSEYDQGIPQ